MAPILLGDKPIARRTLGHDMESFFAVIIWIATLDYSNEAAFRAKPLAVTLLNKEMPSIGIVHAKKAWFKTSQSEFRNEIVNHFEPYYRIDSEFITCLSKLRRILYLEVDEDDSNNEVKKSDSNSEAMESADPMKEGLFRACMKEIDDYLRDTKGSDEMKWIDAQAIILRQGFIKE
jgi:hypothetical protein